MAKIRSLILHPRLPLMAACLAFLLGLPFLGLGFQVDDYFHRAVFVQPASLDGLFGSPFSSMFSFFDGNPERTNQFVARGMVPWFTQADLKLRYWRPLTVATHWLDYALWPDAPWLMHLHSLAWFGAAVFVTALLYRRLMGPTLVAGVATLLFAIDDAHALPAGWIANRNSLVALVLGVSVLLLHDRWRRDGKKPAALLAVACLALALAAKESAIAVCAYLFAYAVVLDRGPWLRRLGSLAPYAVVVILWRAYYQWADYGASGTEAYVDPVTSPLTFLRVFFFRAPLFLASQFGLPPSDFYAFSAPTVQPFLVAWSVLVVLVLAPFFIPLVRKDATARFWALGMLLSIIPICSTGPMDRLLDFVGIGAMGLLAQFLITMRERDPGFGVRWMRRARRWAYLAMFTIHLILAPLMFIGMMSLFAFASRIFIDAVDEAVPRDEGLSQKTVVLANASNYPIGLYLFVVRALEGEPMPAALRSLAAPSLAAVPLEIERIGETALRVSSGAAYGTSVFLGEPSYHVGDRIELSGLTIEVVEVREDGWPESLIFDFGVPLEDPSLIWLEVQAQYVRPWTPPKVGESVVLNDS